MESSITEMSDRAEGRRLRVSLALPGDRRRFALVAGVCGLVYLLMVWRVRAVGGLPGDRSVLQFTHDVLPQRFEPLMRHAGGVAALSVTLAMLVSFVLIAARRGATRRGALMVVLAVGGSLVVKELTKHHVPRPMIGFQPGLDQFPSGHAAATMALALALVVQLWNHRLRWLVVAAAIVYTAAVGFARIWTEIHYTSDVLAGWVVAIMVVAALTAVMGVPPKRAA